MELFAADGHDAGGCERVTGKSGMRPIRSQDLTFALLAPARHRSHRSTGGGLLKVDRTALQGNTALALDSPQTVLGGDVDAWSSVRTPPTWD